MGISSILGAVLKNVPWHKIATAAMEYAPDLYAKAKERFQQQEERSSETVVEHELQERVSRLEKLLLEQDDLIRSLVAKNASLEETISALSGRLLLFKVGSGCLLFAAAVMLLLLLKQP